MKGVWIMDIEQAIDKIFESFDYVREIGRGGSNHIGIELTVSTGTHKKPQDKESREGVKQFILDAIKRGEEESD